MFQRRCEICGEVFNRGSNNQRYCGEKCKREAKNLYSREKRRTEKLDKLNEQSKIKNGALSEVARKANAMGLTYGQYMTLQKGGD